MLFGEAGWAIIGIRDDKLRTDLRAASGDTTAIFNLLPSVALFGSFGGNIPVTDRLGVVPRLEYCLRYYKGRNGEAFADNLKHGTQNMTPYVM